jgi:hypothetical protein
MKHKRLVRGLANVIYVGAVIYLVYLLVDNGWSSPALAVAIVSALMALLGQIGFKPGRADGGKAVSDVEDSLRESIKDLWHKEAKARHLDGPDLMPIRLVRCDTDTAVLATQNKKGSWTSAEYRKAASDVVLKEGIRRAVVYGGSGSGKTTFALMLTRGLVDEARATGGGFLPLLLSLASWDPREDFAEWFGRVATITYPELNKIELGERTLLERLQNSGRVLLVLDGLDELPHGAQNKALEQINKKVLLDQPLILLCRNNLQEIIGNSPAGSCLLNILEIDAGAVQSYFSALTLGDREATQYWGPVLDELEANPDGELAHLLRIPLFASLARGASQTDKSLPQRLVGITSVTSVSKAKEILLDSYVARGMNLAGILRSRRSIRWLEFIAHKMQAYPTRSLAWWRMSAIVPQWVLAAAIGIAVGPAYRLALVLPEGLTRGFTVGCTTAFALGLLRGITPRPSASAVTGVVTFAMVAAIGGTQLGWPNVLPDIAEIGVAMSVVMLCKTWLAGHRIAGNGQRQSWAKVAIAAVVAGAAAAAAVFVVHAVFPGVQLVTGLPSVGRAVALGVGVATMACRLISAVDAPNQPSVIDFGIDRRFGPPWRHLSSTIVSSTAVGIAGGFVGGMNHGLDYGVRVALIFGLLAGLPIGVTGGLLRWLTHLDPQLVRSAASPQKTMRNDRIVAIASIIILGLVSAAFIGLLLGPLRPVVAHLHSSTFRVSPFDGLFFGLALGMPFVALTTAWPAFFVSHTWFALTGRLPWRFRTFLRALHDSELLRQEGTLYQFRHDELQTWLAARYTAAWCQSLETMELAR